MSRETSFRFSLYLFSLSIQDIIELSFMILLLQDVS